MVGGEWCEADSGLPTLDSRLTALLSAVAGAIEKLTPREAGSEMTDGKSRAYLPVGVLVTFLVPVFFG
jgi:hypothetical protein